MNYNSKFYKVVEIIPVNGNNMWHEYMRDGVCRILGEIEIGRSCVMDFMNYGDGNTGGMITTSRVSSYGFNKDGSLVIHTANTIYKLKEYEE